MNKKYELTEETKKVAGKILHRIKALVDIEKCGVKAGDLGGFIESENNLSHYGTCWVADDALVFGEAKVEYDSIVAGKAQVRGFAHIGGDARIADNALVFGFAHIYDDARVYGYAKVADSAEVYGDAQVYGFAQVFGITHVFDNSKIYEEAVVSGNACVYENAKVYNLAEVSGNAEISGNTEIYGDAHVSGNACITGDALIANDGDYATIKGFGSEHKAITFFNCLDNKVRASCDSFYGTISEFREYVKDTSEGKEVEECLLIADLMEKHFDSNILDVPKDSNSHEDEEVEY